MRNFYNLLMHRGGVPAIIPKRDIPETQVRRAVQAINRGSIDEFACTVIKAMFNQNTAQVVVRDNDDGTVEKTIKLSNNQCWSMFNASGCNKEHLNEAQFKLRLARKDYVTNEHLSASTRYKIFNHADLQKALPEPQPDPPPDPTPNFLEIAKAHLGLS